MPSHQCRFHPAFEREHIALEKADRRRGDACDFADIRRRIVGMYHALTRYRNIRRAVRRGDDANRRDTDQISISNR